MIRIDYIQRNLKRLVGWEQDIDPTKQIKEVATRSESHLYFQQAHPLLTLDNVRSILPDQSNITFPTYYATVKYHKGNIVTKDNVNYICRQTSIGNDPDVTDYNEDYNEDYGNAYWAVYDQLSEELDKSIDAGIATVVNRFLNDKSERKESKQLLEHKTLFDGAGRLQNRVVQSHSLVGYEIQLIRGIGITAQIHKIGLQMTGGVTGAVTMYLFHSSKNTPVATYTLRVMQSGVYQWFDRDTYLRYLGEGNNAVGGTWYLCYAEDDLPEGMEAVNISKDFSREPCQSCNKGSVETWRAMTRYLRVSPFRVAVDSGFGNNPTLPDLSALIYTPTTCYGINLELSIGCDLSDFIVAQRQLFAPVLQKQVAYDMLLRIAFNPDVNVNRNQLNVSRQDFLFELDGNTYTRSAGLRGELNKAYDAIEIDTTGMDSACLACGRRGVKYGVA